MVSQCGVGPIRRARNGLCREGAEGALRFNVASACERYLRCWLGGGATAQAASAAAMPLEPWMVDVEAADEDGGGGGGVDGDGGFDDAMLDDYVLDDFVAADDDFVAAADDYYGGFDPLAAAALRERLEVGGGGGGGGSSGSDDGGDDGDGVSQRLRFGAGGGGGGGGADFADLGDLSPLLSPLHKRRNVGGGRDSSGSDSSDDGGGSGSGDGVSQRLFGAGGGGGGGGGADFADLGDLSPLLSPGPVLPSSAVVVGGGSVGGAGMTPTGLPAAAAAAGSQTADELLRAEIVRRFATCTEMRRELERWQVVPHGVRRDAQALTELLLGWLRRRDRADGADVLAGAERLRAAEKRGKAAVVALLTARFPRVAAPLRASVTCAELRALYMGALESGGDAAEASSQALSQAAALADAAARAERRAGQSPASRRESQAQDSARRGVARSRASAARAGGRVAEGRQAGYDAAMAEHYARLHTRRRRDREHRPPGRRAAEIARGDLDVPYWSAMGEGVGDARLECRFCGALHLPSCGAQTVPVLDPGTQEPLIDADGLPETRVVSSVSSCCMGGKLADALPLWEAPLRDGGGARRVYDLWRSGCRSGRLLRKYARALNNALALSWLSVRPLAEDGWNPTLVVNGRLTTYVGALEPPDADDVAAAKYAQLYVLGDGQEVRVLLASRVASDCL